MLPHDFSHVKKQLLLMTLFSIAPPTCCFARTIPEQKAGKSWGECFKDSVQKHVLVLFKVLNQSFPAKQPRTSEGNAPALHEELLPRRMDLSTRSRALRWRRRTNTDTHRPPDPQCWTHAYYRAASTLHDRPVHNLDIS